MTVGCCLLQPGADEDKGTDVQTQQKESLSKVCGSNLEEMYNKLLQGMQNYKNYKIVFDGYSFIMLFAKKVRRKEMFYLTVHSTYFIDSYMTQLRTTLRATHSY